MNVVSSVACEEKQQVPFGKFYELLWLDKAPSNRRISALCSLIKMKYQTNKQIDKQNTQCLCLHCNRYAKSVIDVLFKTNNAVNHLLEILCFTVHLFELTLSLIHYFETVPNSQKLQTTT